MPSGPAGIASPALSRLTKPMRGGPGALGKRGPSDQQAKQRPDRRGGDREEGSRHRRRIRLRRVKDVSSALPSSRDRPESPRQALRVGGPYRRMEWLSRAGVRPATSTKSLSSATARRPAHEVMPRWSTPLLRFGTTAVGCSAPSRAGIQHRHLDYWERSDANSPSGLNRRSSHDPRLRLPRPQTRPTGCRCRTDSGYSHHHRSCRFRSPDSGTGVKGIPSLWPRTSICSSHCDGLATRAVPAPRSPNGSGLVGLSGHHSHGWEMVSIWRAR